MRATSRAAFAAATYPLPPQISASAAASVETTFVFRPGGVAFKNVFTSWAALVAAAGAVAGPRTIEFDDTFAACIIPAGVWNFGPIEDVTFFGINAFSTLTIADGATLIGFWKALDLNIVYQGTATACIAAKPFSLYTFETCTVATTGGQPFIRNSTGFFVAIIMLGPAQAGGFGSGVVFDNALGFIQLVAYDDAFIGANALSGVTFFVNSASPATAISLTQPGIVGGLVPNGNYFPESKPVNTIVIDAAAVNPTGNVFNTFAQAVGFAAQFSGPKTFEFRGAAAVIAPGAYSLGVDPVTITSQNGGFPSTLTIADGATFPSPPIVNFVGLNIHWLGSTPLMDFSSGVSRVFFDDVNLNNTGAGATAAFVQASGTGIVIVSLIRASQAFPTGGGGASFASVTLGSFLAFDCYDSAVLGVSSCREAGGGLIGANQTDGVNVNLPQVGFSFVVGTSLIFNSSTDKAKGPGGGTPALQAGVTTLAGGVSPVIPVVLTATSRIVVSPKTLLGTGLTTNGVYAALSADRNVGLQQFQVTCFDPVAGGPMAGNTSDVDWEVVN